MPKTQSANLTEIFKAYKRYDTLGLTLHNNAKIYLSRGPVVRDAIQYNNSIASVSQFRQSFDDAIDRITVNCQNVNSLLGFNIASNLRLLDFAFAEYGRIYKAVRNPNLVEDFPQFFRGILANAEADETRISFEIIIDYEALGNVIAARSLSPRCSAFYKNGIECTATGANQFCKKTIAACIENHPAVAVQADKKAEFLGWEFWEDLPQVLPGGGGNDGDGTGGGQLPCFTGETRIKTPEKSYSFVELKNRFEQGKKSIISFNPETGEIEEDEIEEIFVHDVTGYFTFKFEHSEINVTPEHPFFVGQNEFKSADNFKRGDAIKIHLGGWCNSELLEIKWNSDVQTKVYNCRVKKNHTYFANSCGVHNSKNETNQF